MEKTLDTTNTSLMPLILTVLLYFIARFTLSNAAAVATILAAGTTITLGIIREVRERKEERITNSKINNDAPD